MAPQWLTDRSELKSRSRLPNWSSASHKAPWSLDYVVKAEQKSRSIRFDVPHVRRVGKWYKLGDNSELLFNKSSQKSPSSKTEQIPEVQNTWANGDGFMGTSACASEGVWGVNFQRSTWLTQPDIRSWEKWLLETRWSQIALKTTSYLKLRWINPVNPNWTSKPVARILTETRDYLYCHCTHETTKFERDSFKRRYIQNKQ